jgi:hypothetical protein
VEDRDTPGLYLEMTDGAPDDYASARVDDVLGLDHVSRATWWRNAKRDRQDLPRVLPEFDTLGVYEVESAFDPPSTPDGITGHHFRRTPRPGQGRLTGRPTVGLSLVLISPTDDARAQELRDWGDFVHLSWIAAVGVPGYTMITPYEHATGGDPRFLHFYEMDTEDAEHSFKLMTPLVEARFGVQGSDEFQHWGWHDALRIRYVNSFIRAGERSPGHPSAS